MIRIPPALVLAAFATALVGCAPTSPRFDQEFSQSSRILRAQQVRNPNAPVENQAKAPDGMDGRAARETVERYQRTFIDPPRVTNVFSIGVGGAAESGGAR